MEDKSFKAFKTFSAPPIYNRLTASSICFNRISSSCKQSSKLPETWTPNPSNNPKAIYTATDYY
jgi:hypothetical protein